MDTGMEVLAEFVLECIVQDSLSDATVYEFTEKISSCVRRGAEFVWGLNLKKLWNYFAGGYPSEGEGNARAFFLEGRIYAALELLRLFQSQKKEEETLQDDAKRYREHWQPVFEALKDGSMTHGALAEACGLSDSSLTQFLHRIEEQNYIQFRKAGRTKYYRLTGRGKLLLDSMSTEKESVYPLGDFKSDTMKADYKVKVLYRGAQLEWKKQIILSEVQSQGLRQSEAIPVKRNAYFKESASMKSEILKNKEFVANL